VTSTDVFTETGVCVPIELETKYCREVQWATGAKEEPVGHLDGQLRGVLFERGQSRAEGSHRWLLCAGLAEGGQGVTWLLRDRQTVCLEHSKRKGRKG
jgi:hypothetical protein